MGPSRKRVALSVHALYSITPAGVSKPSTRAKCRYSSGPQAWRQTRQVQPSSVMICSAGTRTRSPAESRRNTDLARRRRGLCQPSTAECPLSRRPRAPRLASIARASGA